MESKDIFIIFLRGINVGGNIMVSMRDLVQICTDLGFENARSYLNSGNLIIRSSIPEVNLREILETGLFRKFGKKILITIRNAVELEQIINSNPFSVQKGSQVGVMMVNDIIEDMRIIEFGIKGKEEIILGNREIYVYYPDGMGRSTLKWPKRFTNGTIRNINTLTKLVSITKEMTYQNSS
ncbi:DUF1697 domain-containing protein [Methanospirillum lacunae]|uniref:DUF1697 domain-containing protein n=1 Tax=Methanospirillum lacunae TaxID=668570 RepID=A0A2V2ND36_9EURY|nr:DUF1697 domain-containing protein [Methanospirillum lacunae]PWR74328.1 hypothetical protein DK846_04050 [Methanospirillum lacunae]